MTIFLLITVTTFLAIGVLWAVGLRFRSDPIRAMRAIAQMYDGKFTQTKNPDQTAVSFDLHGQPAMLRIKPPVGYAGRYLTEFRTTWPEPRLRLQIQPRKTLRPDFFYDESPTIESGDADFDAKYRLYAEQPETARRLIAAGLFSALDELNQMTRPGAAYVEIHDGFLFVTLEKTFGYADQLEVLVAYCCEIRIPSTTITPNDEQLQSDATPASVPNTMRTICNACGDVVKEDGVACNDCGAIYHRRCWDPKVGCVLYSCEGTTATEASLTH
ncbi:RING finger protein [Blastopirellula marina]|uniref:Phorbol-ester/DAG-type domain-containing protein n=1 Tax=Blastopirellula marina DSM 3645 TaxID=314230 RepID=A3ZZM9_9BACT|nr:RING finger protein [Blastopirellula marina]EAQ78005.1 hypothetical protein DSM3645_16195 [Blastopirellula marina DSM 3645]